MKYALPLVFILLAGRATWAQAPTIGSRTPARNATSAPRTGPVSLTFSQPLSPGAGALLRVHSTQRGGRLAGAATVTGNTVTFAPAQPWQPGETVRVTVPATVTSTSGTALAAAQVYAFTAAATGGTGLLDWAGAVPAAAPTGLAVADLDNDGDLDFLVGAATGTAAVGVRLNDGTGRFNSAPDAAIGTGYTQNVGTADLDGDGDLDLLAQGSGT